MFKAKGIGEVYKVNIHVSDIKREKQPFIESFMNKIKGFVP